VIFLWQLEKEKQQLEKHLLVKQLVKQHEKQQERQLERDNFLLLITTRTRPIF
jgi:hypothetical protein